MLLLKCCTRYVSKFGKLTSGHKTGKGQFSFQSPKPAVPKNAQTTVQLLSFHMLATLCPKSFKLSFSVCELRTSRCTSWVSKRPNCQHLLDCEESNGVPEKHLFLLQWLKFLTVWTTNWEILKEMRIADHLTCLLRNLYAGQGATFKTGH